MWPELTVYIFTQTRCAKCKNSLYIYRPFIHLQIEKFEKLLLSNIAMQHQLIWLSTTIMFGRIDNLHHEY